MASSQSFIVQLCILVVFMFPDLEARIKCHETFRHRGNWTNEFLEGLKKLRWRLDQQELVECPHADECQIRTCKDESGGDLFVISTCAQPPGAQSKCSFGEIDGACPNKAFECTACKGNACNGNGMLQLKKSGADAAAPLPAFAAMLLLFSLWLTHSVMEI